MSWNPQTFVPNKCDTEPLCVPYASSHLSRLFIEPCSLAVNVIWCFPARDILPKLLSISFSISVLQNFDVFHHMNANAFYISFGWRDSLFVTKDTVFASWVKHSHQHRPKWGMIWTRVLENRIRTFVEPGMFYGNGLPASVHHSVMWKYNAVLYETPFFSDTLLFFPSTAARLASHLLLQRPSLALYQSCRVNIISFHL